MILFWLLFLVVISGCCRVLGWFIVVLSCSHCLELVLLLLNLRCCVVVAFMVGFDGCRLGFW